MSFPSSPDADAAAAPGAIPSPATLAIHLDLVGGLAGDMFVAALVDALPGLEADVLAELAKMRPDGAARPCFRSVVRGGLRARRFGVDTAVAGALAADVSAADPSPARASTTGGIHSHHAGTSYAELRRTLGDAPLTATTREHALALLALLGEAEAHVHGIAVDEVHFHELADWDSLLDLVAAGAIAARLHGARWSASALPIGGGNVRTAHGLIPVPAPATSYLLRGYPWCDDRVAGERVTPTGAAILRHLVPAAACAGRREAGRLAAIGCGAGMRELSGVPNIVRALVIEHAAATGTDQVALVEFDVDDMTGEEIALAADRLRALAGVVDVSVGSRVGKKGRPLADFRVLAVPDAVDSIAQACFSETSTLGLRVREERRQVLARAEVPAPGGGPRVKVAERPGHARTAKAAQDDVAHVGGLAARRRLRAASESGALDGDDA